MATAPAQRDRTRPRDRRSGDRSQERARELVDAVQRLSLARSVADVQRVVRGAARRLTGADGATFVLREGGSCFYADEEAIAPLWKGQRFPLSACISGWSMLNRQAVVIEDIYADDRIPHDAYRPTFVRSLAMVPIRTVDPVGAIGNYWAEPHLPTDEEVGLLQALADSTAVALENVRVYEDLERRVRDRTAELEQRTRELQSANERLVELDALRTRFAHATAHELRSPLTAVLGFASMLTARLPEPEAGSAALIYQSATRLSTLVDDLLNVAELEHDGLQLRREPVRISDLIAGSLRAFEPAAAEAGIRLESDVHDELTAEADQLRLAQLLDNLISNAIKYTPSGGSVTVRAESDADDVIVQVSDDGIGIDEGDKGRVFEPFYRTGPGRDSAHGTGLGLSISREIAHAHGGSLTVRDTPGGGTTFRLSLPRRAPSA